MLKNNLLKQLQSVSKIANMSKLSRMLNNPAKYMLAMYYSKILPRRTDFGFLKKTKTFYGKTMNIKLPSSTDIYLTGGKSHASEIRLAKYLIKTLGMGDLFVDVGAHYGYFTLLAAKLVGSDGLVLSYEASTDSFKVLDMNAENESNIKINNVAVSDTKGTITFHQFSNLYSEYNAIEIDQYKNEPWFDEKYMKSSTVPSTTLDMAIEDIQRYPKIIKIDIEGAEYKAILGYSNSLETNNIIVLEYLEPKRSNDEHRKCSSYLFKKGYKSYLIDESGSLNEVDDIELYLEENNLESDNIVFKNY